MKPWFLWGALSALFLTARADVPTVRREVARIERALPLLPQQTSHRTDLSSEGAIVTVCGAARSPRKIRAQIFGEEGRTTDTLYLQHGAPIFRFSVEERYNQPMTLASGGKVISRVERRYYFQNARLLEMRTGARKTPLSAASKRGIEVETQRLVRSYLAGEDGTSKAAR